MLLKMALKQSCNLAEVLEDQDSIDMADKYGIAMVFTNVRHFRH